MAKHLDLPGEFHQPVSFPFSERTFNQKKITYGLFNLSGISQSLGWNDYEEKDAIFWHVCTSIEAEEERKVMVNSCLKQKCNESTS